MKPESSSVLRPRFAPIRRPRLSRAGLAGLTLAAACTALDPVAVDGRDDPALADGKADGYTDCELAAVVDWLNFPQTSEDVLLAAGVHAKAASSLVAHRNGPDAELGTGDDDLFDDIAEVDAVAYVGTVAMRKLVEAVEDRCAGPAPAGEVEVFFSPQPWAQSHLARVVSLLQASERSVDIAMYSFRDAQIMEALRAAVGRGVSIRMIFDPASKDRSDPEGTTTAKLEEMGIEVRWINKVMHHKFALFDGYRAASDVPGAGTLITGSANWSNSGGTVYDENTLVFVEHPELNLRFQAEFNHLWENSRPVEWNEEIEHVESEAVDGDAIPDDPNVETAFTSSNFDVRASAAYGPTFSVVPGRSAGAELWVRLIEEASRSIWIASGHLRSRAVAEALMAKKAAHPDLDIRVYLDGQEYVSAGAHADQVAELEDCLDSAGDSERRRQDCLDRGFLFGYQVEAEGNLDVRYKYYAYRWDAGYAVQMHHKYMLVDGEHLIVGSYNLSDNAEHNTMENVVRLERAGFPSVLDAFAANFERIWQTGEAQGLYDVLTEEIAHGTGNIPLVFDAMALTWAEVGELKRAIRAACADVDSPEYRENPTAHRYCPR